MEFTLAVLLVVQLVRYVMNRQRFRRLEEQIAGRDLTVQAQIRELTTRLYRLENAVERMGSPGDVTAAAVASPVEPPPIPQFHSPEIEPEPESDPTAEPEPQYVPAEPAGPTLTERLRAAFGGEEWEALVGGSLLNKLGALVLVVGFALLLGYSFNRIPPAGRAAIALSISVAILAAGVWTERAERYRVFARGLIGAGWAALYATAYAIYALPVAKLIDDPFTGSLGVLLVAGGMIAIRCSIAPSRSPPSLTSPPSRGWPLRRPRRSPSLHSCLSRSRCSIWPFDWNGTAWPYSDSSPPTAPASLGAAQPRRSSPPKRCFLSIWMLFEAFDLLRTHRRASAKGLGLLAPLNATGFLGLSYFAWAQKAPEQLWLVTSFAAALYFASALARLILRPAGQSGGYEFASTVSALLTGLAIVAHVPGVWMSVGLAVEAEALYLAGVRWNSRILRVLGAAAFFISLGRLYIFDYQAGRSPILHRDIANGTPPVLLHAFFFYLNRVLRRPNPVFSFAASALLAAVICSEAPTRWIGTSLILFATVLMEIGLRKRLGEFRIQAYLLTTAGTGFSILSHAWPPLAMSLAVLYANSLRCQWMPEDTTGIVERKWLQRAGAGATVIFALLLTKTAIPAGYLGLGVCLLAAALLELGFQNLPPQFRMPAYAVWILGVIQMVLTDPGSSAKFAISPLALSYGAGALVGWFFCARITGPELLRHIAAAGGTLLVMRALWIVLPEPLVAVAWTAIALITMEFGLCRNLKSLSWTGNGVMAVVAVRLSLSKL